MKKEHDFSLVAFSVVQQATGEAAVLGAPKRTRRGAQGNAQKDDSKGDASRMASLTPEQQATLGKTAAMKQRQKPPAITGG